MSENISIDEARKKTNEIIKQMKDEISEKDWALDKVIDVLGLKIDDRKASKKDLYIALNRRLRRMDENFEADFLSFVGNEENFKTENLEANKELLVGMQCKMINIFFVRNMIKSWFSGADNQVEFSAKLEELQQTSKSNIDFLLESVDNKGEILFKNFGIYDLVGFNGIDGYIPGYFEENGEYQEGYFKIYTSPFRQFIKIYEREWQKFCAPLVGNVNFSSSIPDFKTSDEAKRLKKDIISRAKKNLEETKKRLEKAKNDKNKEEEERLEKEALQRDEKNYRDTQSEKNDGFGFGCYLNAAISLMAQRPILYLCFLKLANQIFEPNTFDPVPKSDVMLHTLKSEYESLNNSHSVLVAMLDYIKALDDAKKRNYKCVSPLYLKKQLGKKNLLFSPYHAADVQDLFRSLVDSLLSDLGSFDSAINAILDCDCEEILKKSLNNDPELQRILYVLLINKCFDDSHCFLSSDTITNLFWHPGYKKIIDMETQSSSFLSVNLVGIASKVKSLSSLGDIVRYNGITCGDERGCGMCKKTCAFIGVYSSLNDFCPTSIKSLELDAFLLLNRGKDAIGRNSIVLPSLIKIGNEYNDYLMLSGVAIHTGSSDSSGHYYSVIRDEGNVFYEVSDRSVRKIDNLVLEKYDDLKRGSSIVLYKRINRNIFDLEVKHGAKYEDFSEEVNFDSEKLFTPLYLHGSVEKLKEVMCNLKLIDKTGNLSNDTNSNGINSEQAEIDIGTDKKEQKTVSMPDNDDIRPTFFAAGNNTSNKSASSVYGLRIKQRGKEPDLNENLNLDTNEQASINKNIKRVNPQEIKNINPELEIEKKKSDSNENVKLDFVVGNCSGFDEFFKMIKSKNGCSNIVQVLNSRYEEISFMNKVIAFFSALLFCIWHRDFSDFMICIKSKAIFALPKKCNININMYAEDISEKSDLSKSIENIRERINGNKNIQLEDKLENKLV